MRMVHNGVDSWAWGRTVLDLQDFEGGDLTAAEARWRKEEPAYVACKVPSDDLAKIHALEDAGFRFVEFQLRSVLRVRRPWDLEGLPYTYEEVDAASLPAVLELAASTFTADRFSRDPAVPEGVSGRRYSAYTRQSFNATDELLHRFVHAETGELLGFNSCRITGPKDALLFNAGVAASAQGTGLGVTLNRFAFSDLYERGVRRITTHQSAANHPILNAELAHMGFAVTGSWAVLRKVY